MIRETGNILFEHWREVFPVLAELTRHHPLRECHGVNRAIVIGISDGSPYKRYLLELDSEVETVQYTCKGDGISAHWGHQCKVKHAWANERDIEIVGLACLMER